MNCNFLDHATLLKLVNISAHNKWNEFLVKTGYYNLHLKYLPSQNSPAKNKDLCFQFSVNYSILDYDRIQVYNEYFPKI